MQMMSASHAAPVLADQGLLDPQNILTLAAAAVSGGSLVKLMEVVAGRRKLHADAASVVTGAMAEVMTAAVELLKPQAEQLQAIQDRHRHDLQELRDEHSAAMARVQTEHGAAMDRLGNKIEELQIELRNMRSENAELRGRLEVHATGETPIVKSVDSSSAQQ